MKLTGKEISALLAQSAEMRYDYSIKRIADADCLWTVISNDGSYCLIADNGYQIPNVSYMAFQGICGDIFG